MPQVAFGPKPWCERQLAVSGNALDHMAIRADLTYGAGFIAGSYIVYHKFSVIWDVAHVF